MAPGNQGDWWVPLPPKLPQTPPQRPRRDYGSDMESDYDVEERRPGSLSPRPIRSPNRRPLRPRPEIHQHRNLFDEPEVIEVAPDSVRRSEEAARRRAERERDIERRERIRAEQDAQRNYNTVMVTHDQYQQAINGITDQPQRMQLDNNRLQRERDQAQRRGQLAEQKAALERRKNELQHRENALNAEGAGNRQPPPRIFQDPGPVRNPGINVINRAQADHRRQDEELRRRNRERDRERGIRRGSPVRFDDREGRRDRRI